MMPVRSLIGIAILLILVNGAFAFGQSERSRQSALSTTAVAPQILLQVKFYEFDLTSENESALAELQSKVMASDAAGTTTAA